MSQLQVTGEAKIRDIQGPVVANSGVVTALDGAASQYVRGDGTLADFPTSSGGGSSVSYYLNSSVSQGTIGGVAYRELSKEPIIGAGTDIAISANGYVANYLTDANDPDVLSIPGGNFNCEFYFSVNNNTGNPTTYAELYKYDGTTFTLLGTSAGVPESINQGTTIAPYYFAIPVATAALSVTDRLAIRIYVNVDSRTVTLHTENGHLCQVVTTLSKGMVSLNNLTDQSQYLATGTSGTNFAIVSSGDTHTFNLPDASASARGLINTGSQNIAGTKAFYDSIYALYGVMLNNGTIPTMAVGYAALSGNSTGLSITYRTGGGTNYTNNLNFPSNNNSYAFPATGGTLALTSDLSSYVPYTGATTNVNLGVYSLTANQVIAGGAGVNNAGTFTTYDGGVATLLVGSTGNLKFFPLWNPSIGARINAEDSAGSAYIPLSFYASNFYFHSNVNFNSTIGNGTYTYTLPSATGTLALTSNLSAYLPLTGGTLTGALIGTSATFNGQLNANYGYFGDTGAGSWVLYTTNNDQSNARIRMNNSGAGGQTFDLVSGLNGTSNAGWSIYDATNGATRFAIASTGAATFSSTITSGDITTNGNNKGLYFNGTRNAILGNASTEEVVIATANATRMTINSSGNVGIGTSSPSGRLTVAAPSTGESIRMIGFDTVGDNYMTFFNTAGTRLGYVGYGYSGSNTFDVFNDASDPMIFSTAATEKMRIRSDGAISLGSGYQAANSFTYFPNYSGGQPGFQMYNSSSSAIISFNGNTQALNLGNLAGGVTTLSTDASGNIVRTVSDERLKTNVENLEYGLETIMQLRPIMHNWVESANMGEGKTIGFIAQEVEVLIPEIVNGNEYKSIDYPKIVAVLVKGIQELEARIVTLESKIN